MRGTQLCGWMSGPRNAVIQIAPVKWWLVISRDLLSNATPRREWPARRAINCGRVPSFTSPLKNKAHTKA